MHYTRITVTKRFEFDYAHYLPDYPGKCKNMHGHRGILEVEVSGPPVSPEEGTIKYEGLIMDFGDLKNIVQKQVIEKLDYRLLNEVMFEIPTAENMASWIWRMN